MTLKNIAMVRVAVHTLVPAFWKQKQGDLCKELCVHSEMLSKETN